MLYKDTDYKQQLSSFPASVDNKQTLYVKASVTCLQGVSSLLTDHFLTCDLFIVPQLTFVPNRGDSLEIDIPDLPSYHLKWHVILLKETKTKM